MPEKRLLLSSMMIDPGASQKIHIKKMGTAVNHITKKPWVDLIGDWSEDLHPRDRIGRFTFKPYEGVKFVGDDDKDLQQSTGKSQKDWAKLMGVPEDLNGFVRIEGNHDFVNITATGEGFYFQRSIDTVDKIVYNDRFRIDDDSRYKGHGAEIFRDQVDQLTKAGFKEIRTQAERGANMNGYYTWARLGYEPDPMDKGKIQRHIGEFNKQNGTNVTKFRELMGTKSGQEYWKQHGETFNGVFNLAAGSTSHLAVRDYFKELLDLVLHKGKDKKKHSVHATVMSIAQMELVVYRKTGIAYLSPSDHDLDFSGNSTGWISGEPGEMQAMWTELIGEWNEEDHPRDEIGRFTFSDSGVIPKGSMGDTSWQKSPEEINKLVAEDRKSVDDYVANSTEENGQKMDAARIAMREYKDSVKAAYSAGNITDQQLADIESTYKIRIYTDGFVPVGGKEVYHVSVAADKVEREGLLTQDEVMKRGGVQGLGMGRGGISVTYDKKYADVLYNAFTEMKDALNGRVNIADEFKSLGTDAQNSIVNHIKSTYGGDRDVILDTILNNRNSYKYTQPDWNGPVEREVGPEKFIKAYYNSMTMFSDKGREWIALSAPIDGLKNADIGIFKTKTKPNARGEILPAEREYHLFSGDAFEKLERITPKSNIHGFKRWVELIGEWNEDEHPRDDDGKFTFKDSGGTTTVDQPKESTLSRARKEITAVRKYSGSGYWGTNYYLRNGSDEYNEADVKEYKDNIAAIDSFLDHSTKYSGVTYRGVNFDESTKNKFESYVSNLSVGSVISDKGFMSTTKSRDELMNVFSDKSYVIELEITGDKGVDISHLSDHQKEEEVLYPRNTKLLITDLNKDTDRYGDPYVVVKAKAL